MTDTADLRSSSPALFPLSEPSPLSCTLAGYFLGTLIPNIQEQIHLVIAIVIFLSLLPGMIKFLSEWRKARSNI